MIIKKDVDIYGMANALNEKICEAESNANLYGYVKVPHGLAHDLQDLLLYMAEREENKEEIKGTEQNPTSDTKRNACKKPNCFGNYCGDDTECLMCPWGQTCVRFTNAVCKNAKESGKNE